MHIVFFLFCVQTLFYRMFLDCSKVEVHDAHLIKQSADLVGPDTAIWSNVPCLFIGKLSTKVTRCPSSFLSAHPTSLSRLASLIPTTFTSKSLTGIADPSDKPTARAAHDEGSRPLKPCHNTAKTLGTDGPLLDGGAIIALVVQSHDWQHRWCAR